jgi:hypothetical protein
MLDADLAVLYCVPTKVLNQAVKRNLERFPSDFMLQLSIQEKKEVVTNCDHLRSLKYAAALPYAFTEQGIAMLSSVLRSKRAVQVNIEIMRASVRLRRMIVSHAELAKRLDDLEKKYDAQFRVVFDAIRRLMAPESRKLKPIGFSSHKGK